MTNNELAELIDFVEDRYGPQRLWQKHTRLGPYDDHQLLGDFAHISLGAAKEAAMSLYRGGASRMNPSDLLGPAETTWRARVASGTDPAPERRECSGDHVWALPTRAEIEEGRHDPAKFGYMALDQCVLCDSTRPTRAPA